MAGTVTGSCCRITAWPLLPATAASVKPAVPGIWIDVVTGILSTAVPGILVPALCTGNLSTVPVVAPLETVPMGEAMRTMVAP